MSHEIAGSLVMAVDSLSEVLGDVRHRGFRVRSIDTSGPSQPRCCCCVGNGANRAPSMTMQAKG